MNKALNDELLSLEKQDAGACGTSSAQTSPDKQGDVSCHVECDETISLNEQHDEGHIDINWQQSYLDHQNIIRDNRTTHENVVTPRVDSIVKKKVVRKRTDCLFGTPKEPSMRRRKTDILRRRRQAKEEKSNEPKDISKFEEIMIEFKSDEDDVPDVVVDEPVFTESEDETDIMKTTDTDVAMDKGKGVLVNPFRPLTEQEKLFALLPFIDLMDLERDVEGDAILHSIKTRPGETSMEALWRTQRVLIIDDPNIEDKSRTLYNLIQGKIHDLGVSKQEFHQSSWGLIWKFCSTDDYLAFVIDPNMKRLFHVDKQAVVSVEFSEVRPFIENLLKDRSFHSSTFSRSYLSVSSCLWQYKNSNHKSHDSALATPLVADDLHILSGTNEKKLTNLLHNIGDPWDFELSMANEERQLVKEHVWESVNSQRSLVNTRAIVAKLSRCDYMKCYHSMVDAKYVKYTKTAFLNECQKVIERNPDNHIFQDHLFTTQIMKCQSITDIKDPFDSLSAYQMLVGALSAEAISTTMDFEITIAFKQVFLETLLSHNNNKAKEYDFLLVVKECLLHYFISEDSTKPRCMNTASGIMAAFIAETQSKTRDCFCQLRTDYQKLSDSMTPSFFLSAEREIQKFIDDNVVITIDKKSSRLVVEAAYLSTQYAMKKLLGKISTDWDTDVEIHLNGKRYLKVDNNIRMPGQNMVVLSPNVVVAKKGLTWDVSGVDAQQHANPKAPDGKNPSDDGSAGVKGNDGQCGGNVLILTDKWTNSKRLTIRSNGGAGGDGQSGGDGKNGMVGKDGEGLTQEQFKTRYPECAKISLDRAVVRLCKQLGSSGLDDYKSGFASNTGFYKKYHGRARNEVIALDRNSGAGDQGFLMHKGTLGERGSRGGQGGKGGARGTGGLKGDVDFGRYSVEAVRHPKVNVITNDGIPGLHGDNGQGGLAGMHGTRGKDNARFGWSGWWGTKTIWKGPGYFKLTYKKKQSETHKIYSDITEMYAGWEQDHIDILHEEQERRKEKTKIITSTDEVQNLKRNRPIVQRAVREMHKEMSTSLTTNTSFLGHKEQLEAMLQFVRSERQSEQQIARKQKVIVDAKGRVQQVGDRKGDAQFHHITLAKFNMSKDLMATSPAINNFKTFNNAVKLLVEYCDTLLYHSTDSSHSVMKVFDKLLQHSKISNSRVKVFNEHIQRCIQVIQDEVYPEPNKKSIASILSQVEDMVNICNSIPEVRNNDSSKIKLMTSNLHQLYTVLLQKHRWTVVERIAERCRKKVSKEDIPDRFQRLVEDTYIRHIVEATSWVMTISRSSQLSYCEESVVDHFDDDLQNVLRDSTREKVESEIAAWFRSQQEHHTTEDEDEDEESNGNLANKREPQRGTGNSSEKLKKLEKLESELVGLNWVETGQQKTQSLLLQLEDYNLPRMDVLNTVIRVKVMSLGIRLGQEVEELLLTTILESDKLDELIAIFAGYPPEHWLSGYTLYVITHLRFQVRLNNRQKEELFQKLKKIQDKSVLVKVCLSFIDNKCSSSIPSFESLLEVLELLTVVKIDDDLLCQLNNSEDGTTSPVSEWKNLLNQWSVEALLNDLNCQWSPHGRSKAAFFLVELINKQGMQSAMELCQRAKAEGSMTGHRGAVDDDTGGHIGVTEGVTGGQMSVTENDSSGHIGVTEGDTGCNTCVTEAVTDGHKCVEEDDTGGHIGVTEGDTDSKLIVTEGDTGGHKGVTEADTGGIFGVTEGNTDGDFGQIGVTGADTSCLITEDNFLDMLIGKGAAPETKERDAHILLDLMQEDPSNSEKLKEKLMTIHEMVTWTDDDPVLRYEIPSMQKCIAQRISKFTKDDIGYFLAELHGNLELNSTKCGWYDTLLALINRGIEILHGFKMRNAQKFSVLSFLVGDQKGLLEQVATGEGKTLIIVVIAIIKCLLGGPQTCVDVVTSSSVLGKRDAKLNQKLYNLFNVTAAHNCHEESSTRREAYQKQVVYGDLGSFQRDYLLDIFHNINIIRSRTFKTIIVDEVDSMLLDKGQNVLYLSHNIPQMDGLTDIYIKIWETVHAPDAHPGDEGVKLVYRSIANMIVSVITVDDIANALSDPQQSSSDHTLETLANATSTWEWLLGNEIVGPDGHILEITAAEGGRILFEGLELNEMERASVLTLLRDRARQSKLLEFPTALTEFVWHHLEEWIKKAFQAKQMEEGDHYIIDEDKSDYSSTIGSNVIIMDKDTGTEQYSSQWSNGLHQFLQLKHKCRISAESLKAVFISNVRYFLKYNTIYGLTGTLGSTIERKQLHDLYKIDYVTIPSFQPSKFIEHEPTLWQSKDKWQQEIVRVVKKMTKVNRPVLVVCENIKAVENLEKLKSSMHTNCHTYKNSYEDNHIVSSETGMETPWVLLATNIAGRGTDLKVSRAMEKAGGLHVILTYIPDNRRIEGQAFGRAARKGERGSGQLIVMAESISDDNIYRKKLGRDQMEYERVIHIQTKYKTTIEREERLLVEYEKLFKEIKHILENNDYKEIAQDVCTDEWAFFLDDIHDHIYNSDDNTYAKMELDKFLAGLKTFALGFKESCLEILKLKEPWPVHMMKLAKLLIKNKKYDDAPKLLQSVIDRDEGFMGIANYYYAHCQIRSSSADDKLATIDRLLACKRFIQTKIDHLSLSGQLVQRIADAYKKGYTARVESTGFEKQLKGTIQLYHSFLSSIDTICGHSVDKQALDTLSIDETAAASEDEPILPSESVVISDYFNQLLTERKLVKPSNVNRHVHEKDNVFDPMLRRYPFDVVEIKERTISLLEKEFIYDESFINVVPNKEEFWKLAFDSKIFQDENVLYLVDLEQLKKFKDGEVKLKPTIIELAETNLVSLTDHEVSKPDSLIFLPEDVDLTLNSSRNYKILDPTIAVESMPTVECMKRLGLVKVVRSCKTSDINFDDHLPKYDSIDRLAFSKIRGLDEEDSEMILSMLIGGGYITDTAFGQSHLITTDPDSIEIACEYLPFRNDIIGVLCHSFTYRLALNVIKHDIEQNKTDDSLSEEDIKQHQTNAGLSEEGVEQAKAADDLGEKEEQATTDNIMSNEEVQPTIKVEPCFICLPAFLPSNPHEDIFRTLCALNIVNETKVSKGIDVEKEIKKITKEIEKFEIFKKSLFYDVFDEEGIKGSLKKAVVSLKSALELWKCGLEAYDDVDSSLVDLKDTLSDGDQFALAPELALFSINGAGHTITLEERKWSWTAIGKMIAIFVIGLAQLAIGLAIEVFSAGALTQVASGFISEGIGDMAFAIECAFKGHCTFGQYWEHKKISLAITVLTGGIGGLLCKGTGKFIAQETATQLGYRYGMKTGASLLGAVVKRGAKKFSEAVATGVMSSAVDLLIDKAMSGMLESISSGLTENVKMKVENHSINRTVKRLVQRYGAKKAMNIISSTSAKDPTSALPTKVSKYLQKTLGGISQGLKGAEKHLQKCGQNKYLQMLGKGAKILKIAKRVINVAAIVENMLVLTDEHLQDIDQQLRSKWLDGTTTEDDQSDLTEGETEVVVQACELWHSQLVKAMQDKIASEVVSPVLNHIGNKFTTAAGKKCQKVTRIIKGKMQFRKFEKSESAKKLELEKYKSEGKDDKVVADIHARFEKAQLKLMEKTKSPKVYAALIESGLPLPLHCVGMIPKMCPDIRITVKDTKNNTVHVYGDKNAATSVHLEFEHNTRGEVGHFSAKKKESDNKVVEGKQNNDCLLSALGSVGIHLSRNVLATHVREDKNTWKEVEKGLHGDYVHAGKIGAGRINPRRHRERIKAGYKINLFQKRRLRDPAKKGGLARKRTGNHEVNECASMPDFGKQHPGTNTVSLPGVASFQFTTAHALELCKSDVAYQVIATEAGELGCHTAAGYGAMAVNNPSAPWFKRDFTPQADNIARVGKGNHQLHKEQTDYREANCKGKTPLETTVMAVYNYHSKISLQPNESANLTVQHPFFSPIGLNLANPAERHEFMLGKMRDDYKAVAVAKKMAEYAGLTHLVTTAPKMECDPQYKAHIDHEVNKAQTFEALVQLKVERAFTPQEECLMKKM